MGQQCCSQNLVDRKVYDPTDNPILKVANKPPVSQIQEDFTKNFTPVAQVPKVHPVVKDIINKLPKYQIVDSQDTPKGTKRASPFAINKNGLVYDANGEWKQNLPHGKGRLIYPDGSLYEGIFIRGVPSGQGRFVSSQGWYYDGQLVKQQAQGQGVFVFQNIGFKYEGQWEGDLPNGRGKETWSKAAKPAVYQGQYINGKKQGKGHYILGEDWEYEGQFSNNQITSSKGRITYKNGETYEGGFVAGKKHGFGIYNWTDGSTFEGWYANDKKSGHGKFQGADGKRFEGEWSNGRRQGRGVLIVNGKKYPGQWKNDFIVSKKQL